MEIVGIIFWIILVYVLIRIFMKPADCPFAAIDALLPRLAHQADIIIVDIHAEATSEKVAMGRYLDGKVSGCFGTHTHVTTADEIILPNGTAYITDLGMTGAHDSVLGRKTENVLKSFRTQMPNSFAVATDDVRISGVIMTIDSATKKAERIERISVRADYTDAVGYDSDDGKPESYNDFN